MYNVRVQPALNIDNPIFFSALTSDCISKRRDMDRGGCRYMRTMTSWICGAVNAINSLASIKKNVYDEKNFTWDEMIEALDNNFGYVDAIETGAFAMSNQVKRPDAKPEWDRIRSLCLKAPKYGNDDPYVDELFKDLMHSWHELIDKTKDWFGHGYVGSLMSVSTHGALGQADIADSAGRLSGLTLVDGSQSPYPGTDVNGPYAILNSSLAMDHARFMNTQLNMKVHPSSIKGLNGSKKLLDLIKKYLDGGAFHIQFNIVDSRMLEDAQKNPESYRDLMVRVAGFTQYWVELAKPIQDEIICRTEYEEVV
jgi:4-hydroxyphenylacetate decarboxylase large subunit